MARPRKTLKKKLKFPNGTGTIQYLGDRRSKPFQAVVTVGTKENGLPLRKSLGCEEDYWKAFDLLEKYKKDNYDIDVSRMTIEEVFERLQPILKKQYEEGKKGMSKSNYKNLLNGYSHLSSIYKEKMVDLKKRDLQSLIDNSELSNTGQGYIKNILCRLFSYFIDDLDGPIEKNPTISLKIVSKEKSDKYIPFDEEELKIIFENKDRFYIKLLLIMLYSGMRPKEVCELETKKTFLDEHYSIGGCKTEAGTNRIIPHHKEVQWIYKEFYNSNNKYVFNNPNTKNKFTPKNLSDNITTELEKLGIYNRYSYSARHNYATQLLFCGVSESNRKWLMGHSQKGDVTNNNYTHIDHKYLLKEINKLKYI